MNDEIMNEDSMDVENKHLMICGKKVSSIGELIEALFISPYDFYQKGGIEKLTQRSWAGAELYEFLRKMGYEQNVEAVWKDCENDHPFVAASKLINMLDTIATRANVNPEIIRSFYISYGPMGIFTYTKKLVDSGVYKPLDEKGAAIISAIEKFDSPTDGSVVDLYNQYMSLVESVHSMQKILIDNPHCITAGEYENNGIITTNLAGCFAFYIYDHYAPLGFCSWIEKSDGGGR